jgi:hypothetical protein
MRADTENSEPELRDDEAPAHRVVAYVDRHAELRARLSRGARASVGALVVALSLLFLALTLQLAALALISVLAGWGAFCALLVSLPPAAILATRAARRGEARVVFEDGEAQIVVKLGSDELAGAEVLAPARRGARGVAVTLEDRSRALLVFASEGQAEAMATRLGGDAIAARTSITVASPSLRAGRRLATLALLALSATSTLGGALFAAYDLALRRGHATVWPFFVLAGSAAATALFSWLFHNPRLEIGPEGIFARGLFGRGLLPIAGVSRITRTGRDVVVRTAWGATRTLRPLGDPWPEDTTVDELAAMLEARATMGVGSTPHVSRRAGLRRADREAFEAWLARLGKLASGATSYREGAWTAEDLEATIVDGSASGEERIAASLALRELDAPRAQARIADALEACVDEELAVALSEAAEGELDEARVARISRPPRR